MLSSGAVLGERYRLEDRVATGGMGDVWRATDVLLGREVAVKILLPTLLTDPSFIARFRAEARMMAALRHTGIVQVFDYGEDELAADGRVDYLVMEYVDGEPLAKRIDEAGRLAVTDTLSVVAQVARALHGAHQAGIVHRDVKPSNLLVQPNGNVVLVDFGVARSANITSVTSANAVPGTVLYMAPEQASGRPVSAATDIYALGAVGYCCLAGHPPFGGDNPLEVAIKHMHDELPPLPDDVPAPVRELIERALAKDPADRFPSAAAFARAARAVLAGVERTAVAPAVAVAAPARTLRAAGGNTLAEVPVVPAGRPARKRGRTATVAGVVLAALLSAGALAAVLGFGPDDDGHRSNPADPSAPASSAPGPEQSAADRDGAGPTGHESGPTRRSTTATPAGPSATAPASGRPTTPPTDQPSQPGGSTPPGTTPSRTQTTPPGGGSPGAG